ncbi:MAG: 4a-hydroxytetrahydrobiopterin dehydratase [Verrucomicrobia bacterium]|nr:MAG: 4a-hydroxytetrahydrobiopterin dehydratase [Verrucomicrobiota bacterium]
MSLPRLTETEIQRLLSTVPHWSRKGEEISRIFEFSNFKEAIAFVNRVATMAEEANHHPDIAIRWNQVSLMLTTKSQKRLTQSDFDLASRIDKLP